MSDPDPSFPPFPLGSSPASAAMCERGAQVGTGVYRPWADHQVLRKYYKACLRNIQVAETKYHRVRCYGLNESVARLIHHPLKDLGGFP
jgi:hypothetical protein